MWSKLGSTVPLLQLRSVRRTYPAIASTHALQQINLDIRAGEFVAIEGPSGGGKSTLLNIIGLLDTPSSGTYSIAGVDAGDLSETESARLRLSTFAFIFQSFHLLDRRPVIDSVELGLFYRGTDPHDRRTRALAALGQVGLSHRAYHQAAALSGGERQRAAIARALASEAPIIIADEPTGNLDSENSRQVMASLHALHNTGATIILVTHSPEIASEASRRVTICDGRIIEDTATSASTPTRSTEHMVAPSGRPSTQGSLGRRIRDVFHDARASIRSTAGRTAGLAAAIGIGVALFVGTLGMSASAATQVSSAFDAHANRDVTVNWNTAVTADTTDKERTTLIERLNTLSGVDAAGLLTSIGQTHTQATRTRPSFDVDGFTITPETATAGRLSIRWASHQHQEIRVGETLVGQALAKKIDLGPLEGTPVILVNNAPTTVVGIIEKSPRFPELLGGITLPATPEAQAAATQQRAVLLTRPGAAQQVARQAPLVIYPYNTSQLQVDAPADPSTLRVRVQQELQATLLAFTIIALLAAAAGLANSMTNAVLERKHEFGLRRAVGATRTQVRNLVLTEATLIGAIGGLLGLLIGLAGILIITVVQRWSPVFDLTLAPAAVAGGILVSLCSGALAAHRAARIQPHQALRA